MAVFYIHRCRSENLHESNNRVLCLKAMAYPEKLTWIGHVWPLKPSTSVVTEHNRSHNNEVLGGFLSQLPNYEAYILQPFEVSF